MIPSVLPTAHHGNCEHEQYRARHYCFQHEQGLLLPLPYLVYPPRFCAQFSRLRAGASSIVVDVKRGESSSHRPSTISGHLEKRIPPHMAYHPRTYSVCLGYKEMLLQFLCIILQDLLFRHRYSLNNGSVLGEQRPLPICSGGRREASCTQRRNLNY